MGAADDNVILIKGDDPEILEANLKAQSTFKYFWREQHWENRRIVKALDMAAVKFAFCDDVGPDTKSDDPSVEHMWVGDVCFDGRKITGVLMNSPRWLKKVKAGDEVEMPLAMLEDWMYVIGGRVYGGYTVSVTRSRMTPRERAEHDKAWGLDFGEPGHIRVVMTGTPRSQPQEKPKGLMGMFAKKAPEPEIEEDLDAEHPASINIVPVMKEALVKDPQQIHSQDERGWTALHFEALGGSAPTVEALLQLGADPRVRTNDGLTALDLARILGWTKVEALLSARS